MLCLWWYFRRVLQERNEQSSDSFYFRIYILVLGVYAGIRIFFALLVKFPACRTLSELSDRWSFFQCFKWIYQVRFDDFLNCSMNQIKTGFDPCKSNPGEILCWQRFI